MSIRSVGNDLVPRQFSKRRRLNELAAQFEMQSLYTDQIIGHTEQSSEILALRDATRNEHKRVEVLMKIGHRFDLTHYQKRLITLTSFLCAWETRVVQVLPLEWQDWFICRRRSVLLRYDLSTLNISIDEQAVSPGVELGNSFAAWGSLYAMEAVATGNRKIAVWLHKTHGIGAQNGGAYFCAGVDRTDALAREFYKILQGVVKGPQPQADACTAAVQTFRALAKTLRNAQDQ